MRTLDIGSTLPRREAICAKCGITKTPTRAYLALLKSQDQRYVCQNCREGAPPPPMDLGKMGVL
jgi:hypothetical protein